VLLYDWNKCGHPNLEYMYALQGKSVALAYWVQFMYVSYTHIQ